MCTHYIWYNRTNFGVVVAIEFSGLEKYPMLTKSRRSEGSYRKIKREQLNLNLLTLGTSPGFSEVLITPARSSRVVKKIHWKSEINFWKIIKEWTLRLYFNVKIKKSMNVIKCQIFLQWANNLGNSGGREKDIESEYIKEASSFWTFRFML